jgi:hypothetical protein
MPTKLAKKVNNMLWDEINQKKDAMTTTLTKKVQFLFCLLDVLFSDIA